VSDTVAILNEGQMIAQAPIEELLAGTGDVVYTVKLRDIPDAAYTSITAQPRVSEIEVNRQNGVTAWQITVTDEAAAEDQLLNLLMGNGAKVADFGRKVYALEDIFLDIVERSKR
jgi:ABC-type multidrug transport system ATPase subunit